MAEFNPVMRLNMALPLKMNLRVLAMTQQKWLPPQEILPFARNALGVEKGQEAAWYAKARWGYQATSLMVHYMVTNRADQVRDLVEPINWAPVLEALDDGKGVALAAAHSSAALPMHMNIFQSSGLPVMGLTSNTGIAQYNPDILDVKDEATRRTALVRAYAHLRDGKVVMAAPSGRTGTQFRMMPFLGQNIRMYTGYAELARMSGSASFYLDARWNGPGKVLVELLRIQPDENLEDEAWCDQWYRTYLDYLADAMKAGPANLGFSHGLWDSENGGLQWRTES